MCVGMRARNCKLNRHYVYPAENPRPAAFTKLVLQMQYICDLRLVNKLFQIRIIIFNQINYDFFVFFFLTIYYKYVWWEVNGKNTRGNAAPADVSDDHSDVQWRTNLNTDRSCRRRRRHHHREQIDVFHKEHNHLYVGFLVGLGLGLGLVGESIRGRMERIVR